jgi:S1-C subfamily serine protease
MVALKFLRAKPACWLLASLLTIPASLPVAQPPLPPGLNQTGKGAPEPKTEEKQPAPAAPDSVLPAVPKPAPANRKELGAAFTKAAPSSITDLRIIEEHVETLITRVSPAVVAVEVGYGSGSGVVISADGLVLTAGHVCGRANRSVRITFADGKTARGKTMGVDAESDTGLMRITDPGPWPHAVTGELHQAQTGDWVLALGHPGGFDLKRSLVVRLGRIIRLTSAKLQTDCTISPGDSGGPLFDMHGRVIGIHSAISFSMADNFHVPITQFYDAWDQLVNPSMDVNLEAQPRRN